jgi:EAL domain-containing protein (putative c-di-GMP-specific phosphodiesterase class I)
LRVVAEGVESDEQIAFLRANNCDEMQGYHFGKPMPAEAISELLAVKPSSGGCAVDGLNISR